MQGVFLHAVLSPPPPFFSYLYYNSDIRKKNNNAYMKQNKSVTLRKRHDNWASCYDDDDVAHYGWRAPEVCLHRLLTVLPNDHLLSVIDVGVGTGQASQAFLEMGFQVTGLDISNNMLQEAKKKHPSFYRLKYYDINQPLATADITKESADVILCCGAMHDATSLDATLADMVSCLRKNGHLAFTYIPQQPLIFSKETITYKPEFVKKLLFKLGLFIVSHEEFIAYYRNNNQNSPVFYGLIVAEKYA